MMSLLADTEKSLFGWWMLWSVTKLFGALCEPPPMPTQSPRIAFYNHLPSIYLYEPTTMPSARMSQFREQTKPLSGLMANLAYSRVADNKDHTISFALTFRVD